MKSLRFAAGILCTVLLWCCRPEPTAERVPVLGTMHSIPKDRLERLLQSRLFFGHQSVGYNIVEGIRDLLAEESLRMRIVETRDVAESAGAGFFHSTIGQNRDALGKIGDFDAIMRSGNAEHLDIVFMKLCYVDVQVDTDVTAIFKSYRDTMARLRSDFPTTVFVHFTVPLVSQEKGIKPLLKKLLGRQVGGRGDNLARERLNALLRDEYAGREPLFDLARFESTRADGSRTVYPSEGERYFALEPAYTTDGGHLNQRGRRYIAEQLIVMLAGIAH